MEANTAALITEGLRGDGAILVNAEGKRFIDEVGTRDVVSAAEIAQTGSYSWLVVDQAMADKSNVIQGYIKKGYTVTARPTRSWQRPWAWTLRFCRDHGAVEWLRGCPEG